MGVMNESKIEYIAVHCSATPPEMEVTAEDINRWHVKRGWTEIGYHFVIRRNGQIEIGRNLDQRGAHVKGYNTNSWSICLIGGLNENGKAENNFAYQQFKALFALLRVLKLMAPRAYIQGHRDFPEVKKDCPCFDVRAMLPQDLREDRLPL